MNNHLDIYIASNSGAPSFNPLDSDGILNAIHVEQIIGTLVRMHPSGRYEGYLAKSWVSSPDFRVWTFHLRSGLSCEDGTPINSRNFSKSLVKVIRLVKRHSEMPLIDRLQGVNEVEKGDIVGIKSPDEKTLQFVFDKPVTSGLLEYLALPYLGFYCERDFNSDGTWKDNKKITSSGAYRIGEWSGEGPVPLILRPEWFHSVENPPQSLRIHAMGMEQIKAPSKRGFIISFLLDKKEIPEKYKVVPLMPTIFHGLVLSTENNEWLKDKHHRQLLRDEVRRLVAQTRIPFEGAMSVDRLYPHMSQPLVKNTDTHEVVHVGKVSRPLQILTVENPSKPSKYMLEIAQRALENLQVPYELKVKERGQKDLMQTFRDPKQYDLRLTSVDSGGGIENQLVRFMFCSNLGVAFPDPGRRICSLVEEYESRFGELVPASEMENYIQRFDSIIDDEAALLPIMKTGHAWLLTEDLPLDAVSPTMGIPYFELLNLKNE